MIENIFTNANIIMADEILHGTLVVRDGRIHDIGKGNIAVPSATNIDQDYLMPGLVELHTDTLEHHMTPRPKTTWPAIAAVIAHDNQIASAGITTVFDALSIGDVQENSSRVSTLQEMINGLSKTQEENLLRIQHNIHLRCEVSYPEMIPTLDGLIDTPLVKMLSVMDHTPGQRQFVSIDAYYTYYQGKYGLSDAEMDQFISKRKQDQATYSRPNRAYAIKSAHQRGLALASHDDATQDHVTEAASEGMTVAEFPTTLEAAQSSHDAGLAVMMGGPNLVRGGSHSGNVAAGFLAEQNCLDILSSDYVPNSLLHGAMLLHTKYAYSLPRAVQTITKTPATSVGLDDRGELSPGKRADLIQMHLHPAHPVIRSVWRQGQRVA